jgi:hypothetical protein
MCLIKTAGIMLAMTAGLWCLYALSQNGRYQASYIGGTQAFVIIDTRTGTWTRTVDGRAMRDNHGR